MRKIFFLLSQITLVLFSGNMNAQNIGIGTNTPHASARLDVTSTNSGLLFPRLTGAQRDAIPNPAAGLAIFCTNCGERGEMQYYDGIGWRSMDKGVATNPVIPVVTTTMISGFTTNSAVSGGNVSVTGGTPVTARGVVWSTSPNPTIVLATKTTDGAGVGSFTSNLSGLTPSTTYYIRAYAINSAGTAYGNELTVTTLAVANLQTIYCDGVENSGELVQGTVAISVSSSIPYTGGNGGTYLAQSIPSTGVTGLTATLAGGIVANGYGSLNYIITGTPTSSGTASFEIRIGERTCSLSRIVKAPPVNPGSITDVSNNTYPTVLIGTQIWMAENLRTLKYNDGSDIPVVTDQTEWLNNSSIFGVNSKQLPMMSWYNNDEAKYTANKFGALYNFYVATGNKNICPVSWHVPTVSEWSTLINFLGGESVAGGKMKTTGEDYWSSPNLGATNSSGFSALPGGFRTGGQFSNIGTNAFFWSTSTPNNFVGFYCSLDNSSASVTTTNYSGMEYGLSVRCLKDYITPPTELSVRQSFSFPTTPTNVVVDSEIGDSGGSPVIARGVVWSTSPNPTIALTTKTSDGTGVGSFTSTISGLSSGTTYFIRAYATNAFGTSYSNEIMANAP